MYRSFFESAAARCAACFAYSVSARLTRLASSLRRVPSVLILFVSLSGNAIAGGNAGFIAGSYSVRQNGDGTASFSVAGIQNTTSSTTSGSLGFELWYSSAPYSGGAIQGYRVAANHLPIGGCTSSQLTPGGSCTGISVTVNAVTPPDGTYYPVLLLTEYSSTCTSSDGYCIDDSVAMINEATGGNTVTVSSGGGSGSGTGSGSGSGSGSAIGGNAEFVPGTYTVRPSSASSADFFVAGIRNKTSNTTTGSLAFELWYSSLPYSGGTIQGYRVAFHALPVGDCASSQLAPGQSCTNIMVTDALTLPPSGTYYPVLLLTEHTSSCTSSNGYCIDAYANMVNEVTGGDTITVGASNAPGPVDTGSGDVRFADNVRIAVNNVDYGNQTASIDVSGVRNITSSTTSGTVRIELWYTSTPYVRGSSSITGHRVTSFRLPAGCTVGQAQLAAGMTCTGISSGTLAITLPPPGTYYAAVLLTEVLSNCSDPSGACIVDGIPLQNIATVPDTTGSVQGVLGESGGGAMGLGSLGALLALALLKGLVGGVRQRRARDAAHRLLATDSRPHATKIHLA